MRKGHRKGAIVRGSHNLDRMLIMVLKADRAVDEGDGTAAMLH